MKLILENWRQYLLIEQNISYSGVVLDEDSKQKLLELPVKSLSDAEKKRRKYLQQQLGSKAKDLRNGLKRRLGETEPKAPKAPRAPETRIRDAAQDIIKVCENIESPTFRPAEIKALAEQIIRSI